jgi:hypothetical protein
MLSPLQQTYLVDEAVSFFTNERVSKMKTESTDDWYLSVWDTLVINEKPPKEEFEAKLQELINAQPLKELRTKRNTLLDQTDRYATLDYPHSNTVVQQSWFDYRQALRDLPANTEDPANPVWPTRPDEVVDTETVTETSNTETVTETSN